MGKAGQVLREVLTTYGISQNKLAILQRRGYANAMGVRSSVVYRWFNERIDPTGDTLVRMVEALKELDREAAKEFVRQYLGEIVEDDSD